MHFIGSDPRRFILLAIFLTAIPLEVYADKLVVVPVEGYDAVASAEVGGSVTVAQPAFVGTYSDPGCATTTCATAVITYSNGDGMVSVTGSSGATAFGQTVEATASLDYYFVVEQQPDSALPTGVTVTSVPIIIPTVAMTSGDASGDLDYAIAGIFATGNLAGEFACLGATSGNSHCNSAPTSFSKNFTTNWVVGNTSEVNISAVFQFQSASSPISFSASVDPLPEIDPSYLYASDFTLDFSPNPPASAVPEPSSVWLAGCCMVGWVGISVRRKRQSRSA